MWNAAVWHIWLNRAADIYPWHLALICIFVCLEWYFQPAKLINWQWHNDSYTYFLVGFSIVFRMRIDDKWSETCRDWLSAKHYAKVLGRFIGENDAWAIFQKVELNGKCHLAIGQSAISCGSLLSFQLNRIMPIEACWINFDYVNFLSASHFNFVVLMQKVMYMGLCCCEKLCKWQEIENLNALLRYVSRIEVWNWTEVVIKPFPSLYVLFITILRPIKSYESFRQRCNYITELPQIFQKP